MKIFFDENCDKQSLVNLYEKNLKNDQKKFAILTKNNNFKGKIIATQIFGLFQIKNKK